MERDYNKNRNQEGRERRVYRPAGERDSYRSENSDRGNRNDNRERSERPQKPAFGERRERRDYREGNRYQNDNRERGNRDSNERRERNFNRDDRGNRSYSSDNQKERREYQGTRDSNRPFRQDSTRRFSRDYNRDDRQENSERKPRYNQERREENTSRERNYNRDYSESRDSRSNRFSRESRGNEGEKKLFKRNFNEGDSSRRERNEIGYAEKEELRQKHYSKKKILAHRLKNENEETELRLNRYISMGGVCSRRDADELIKTGRVKVNGEVVNTVGVKVRKKDKVEVDGVEIVPERKVYLVLNKPKDYVTTVDDPMERKTVMSLVEGACKERVYPVGRLDRQTTGVLLFTNDGDLAKKLTHPKYDHKKIYHVFLDKPVSEQDLQAVADGIQLEDGFIQADEVSYASDDRTEVGIEIHSGKNRIVRRIFEHFGYQIIKLDRVYFAGITKKNLPRGKWRFLTSEEVNLLKFY